MTRSDRNRLQELIALTDMATADKARYVAVLAAAPAEVAEKLEQLFDEDPAWIYFIYDNLVKKSEALRRGDIRAWNAVLDREQILLLRLELKN